MKVTTKALENNKFEVQVECPVEQVNSALDQSYRKVVRNVTIPGFRKGRVPRQILEMRYGAQVLYDDAIEILLPQTYEAALAEVDVEPIAQPEVEVIKFEKEEPAIFKFIVQGPPQVELGQYRGVEVEAVSFPVTDADLEATLQQMQQQQARLVESSGDQVADGDYVTLDYEGFVDGEAFAGGKANDYTLQVGSNTFIPGFESQLIGLSKGEAAEIKVVFPEDYHSEELAGQEAVFKVEIKDIKQRVVPDLDDDFAAEVSEFDTLEELRADIKNKLQESAKQRERNALENKVVEAVVANAEVVIPEAMIEREIAEMIQDLANNLTRQGFPEEFAREYINDKLDSLKEDYREAAQSRVKTRLVLQKVQETEDITVSDEELEVKVQELAAFYRQDATELRKQLEEQGSLEVLRYNAGIEKTIQFLVEAAQITEPVEQAEAPVAQEEETESE
ncbi:MAG: trigger factor [Firmicutes bacterium]|nr:trigger factor [Bacillota bacterium]